MGTYNVVKSESAPAQTGDTVAADLCSEERQGPRIGSATAPWAETAEHSTGWARLMGFDEYWEF